LTGTSGLSYGSPDKKHRRAKAEYAYYDFDSIDTAGPSNVPGEHYRQSIAVTAHTVKAGLNYRF
jgi:opacity protein-like surface antigen